MFTNTNTSFRLIEALTGVQMTEGKLALWLQPILKQLQSACFYYFWWEKRVSLWKTIARQKTIVFATGSSSNHHMLLWLWTVDERLFVQFPTIAPSHNDPCWCQVLQTDITNRVGIKHWLPSLMDSWSKSSGAIHRHSTHNLHPRDPRRRRQSQSCFAYLCYLPWAQPDEVWWAGLGVWRRRPSSDPVSCVTLQAARAAAHQSPDHLPTFTLRCPVFRAQRRPLYFCAWRNPYNPSSIRRRISRIRHVSKMTHRVAQKSNFPCGKERVAPVAPLSNPICNQSSRCGKHISANLHNLSFSFNSSNNSNAFQSGLCQWRREEKQLF